MFFRKKAKPKKKRSTLREWIRAGLIAIVLVWVTKAFFFDLYVVPTTSMEKTVLVGDFVLVNKLSYGPRMPITPLTAPLAHQNLPWTNLNGYSDAIELPYMRAPGFSAVEQNDIIVFNYPLDIDHPVDHRTYYIKRCVALPGQVVTIEMGDMSVSDTLCAMPAEAQLNYRVEIDLDVFDVEALARYSITEGGPTHSASTLQIAMTDSAAHGMLNEPGVLEIIRLIQPPGITDGYTFPVEANLDWNRDNFGPLVVPAAGDSIELNETSVAIYRDVIERYEEHELLEVNDEYFIDGVGVSHYVFEMNYFFVLGDNRHNSADSRTWGFVPENHIVGKAVATLFSFDKNEGFFSGFRWDRFFSGLD